MGVVGIGAMGRHHVRVARSLADVDLVAVFDPFGDPSGVAGGIETARDLPTLAASVDAAVVSVPTREHVEVALALLTAGVHVLVEKPLAETMEGGLVLVRAAEEAGVVLAVGHIERFNPAMRELKKRLDSGDLGELYQISTSRQGPFPERVRDVGVIKDLATHDIDLVRFISSQGYESVSARTAHRTGRPHEDLVSAVAALVDKTVVNHMVNWLTPTKERQVVVNGERGRFVADMLTADLTLYANASVPTEWEHISRFRGVSEGDMVRYAIAKPEPLQVELEGFRDAILHGRGDIVTGTEGIEVLRVAEAMLTSAADGSVVQIESRP